MNMKLELVVLPVTDVDRAKDFYTGRAGFDLLVDHRPNDDFRVVQANPLGSGCSVVFGTGVGTDMTPGSVKGLHIVVPDIEAAVDAARNRGVDIDGPFHFGASGRAEGVDPERRDYGSFAAFDDPDGNSWLLQEIAGRPDWKLEVVVVPVTDAEAAKSFYTDQLGWSVHSDHQSGDEFRVVQMDPPGSPCSVVFGTGVHPGAPGSMHGLHLVVTDLVAARNELVGRGVDVGEPFHFSLAGERSAGVDHSGTDYSSFAEFRDLDGNTYLLQQVTSEGLSVP